MARKNYFPTFWTIVLLLGIAWLLRELGYINPELDIPWLYGFHLVMSMILLGDLTQ